MEEIPLKKSSVAWFKLAEFVGRGEKERALDLHRLLMHSHDSKAFMKQLEADIMIAFDFEQALYEYTQAAHWYIQNDQVGDAAFVYERIVLLCPSKSEYLEKLIDLCAQLHWEEKGFFYKKQIPTTYIHSGKFVKALATFKEVEEHMDDVETLKFYRKFVIQALAHRYPHQKVVTSYLHKALDGLIRFGTEQEMKEFLSQIQALNSVWYKDAVEYMTQFNV